MALWLNGSIKATILAIMMISFVRVGTAGRKYKRPHFCQDTELAETPMTFLWTIKKDPPVFFFGTIHVPYTRVWDYIPENTKRAFEISEKVFFELDLTNPITISSLTNCQMLPDGVHLSDVLPDDIYDRIKSHLEYVKMMMPTWMTADQRGRGLYPDYLFNAITGNWERKRPVWVMLMVNSLTENDIKSRGVPVLDLYLAQEAERLNKNTGAVERVDEQCIPLNKLNFSQVLFALNQTLHQQERIRGGQVRSPFTTDDLIKHYNCGNLNSVIFNEDTAQVPTLVNSSIPPVDVSTARNIDQYFRKELIFKRNRRMANRISQLLSNYPDEAFFFAFGAGHFLGNDTVLDALREQGHNIEQVSANQKIRIPKKWKRRRTRLFSSVDSHFKPLIPRVSYAELEHRNHGRSRISSSRAQSNPKRSSKHRNFQDLWVRIEDYSHSTPPSTTESRQLPRYHLGQGAIKYAWYDLPSSSTTVSVNVVLLVCLSCFVSYCNGRSSLQ